MASSKNEWQKKYRTTAKGWATVAWTNIKRRTSTDPKYKDVELLFDRQAFMAWAVPALEVWMAANPGKKPSVDRILATKHYEPGNVQILELGENVRRRDCNKNVHAPAGHAWCGSCRRYRPYAEFTADRSTFNGLRARCRDCSRDRSKTKGDADNATQYTGVCDPATAAPGGQPQAGSAWGEGSCAAQESP